MKKTSTLLILGIFIIVLTSAYTGYLFWQKSASEAELKRVERTLADHKNKVLQLENQEVLAAITARRAFGSLTADIIKWSSVIESVQNTVPRSGGSFLVDVLSYSGSAGSEISMNMKTGPGSDEPYFDVADLIEAFNDSENFVSGFVPSISSGLDEEGNEILTFLLSAEYVEEAAETISR